MEQSLRSPTSRKLVLERDFYTCQCCGLRPETPEVHHVQPVWKNGTGALNNLITLCSICHRYAPNNAEEFLAYQKYGGARGQMLVGRLLTDTAIANPEMTLKDFQAMVFRAREKAFQMNFAEAATKKPKKSKRQWAREAILARLKKQPEAWLSVAELAPERKERQIFSSYIFDLVTENLILKDCRQEGHRKINVYQIAS